MPLPSPGTVYEATEPLPSHPVGSLPEEISCLVKKSESKVAYPWDGIGQKRGRSLHGGVTGWPHLSAPASLSSSKTTHTSMAFTRSTEEPAPGALGAAGGTEGGKLCSSPRHSQLFPWWVLLSSLMEQTVPPVPLRTLSIGQLPQEFQSFLKVHSSEALKPGSVFHEAKRIMYFTNEIYLLQYEKQWRFRTLIVTHNSSLRQRDEFICNPHHQRIASPGATCPPGKTSRAGRAFRGSRSTRGRQQGAPGTPYLK